MERPHIQITHARPIVTIADIEPIDLNELEKELDEMKHEAEQRKGDMLERIGKRVDEVDVGNYDVITLNELSALMNVHRSSLTKFVQRNNLGHSYARLPDTSGRRQKQVYFTESEAEAVVDAYFKR